MLRRTKRPSWDDLSEGRVRVLLECEAAATPSVIAAVIEEHGYAVRTCQGPEAHDCALLENGACDLVDGADVVVNMLRTAGDGRQILEGTVGHRRPPAVVVEMTEPEMRAGLAADDRLSDELVDNITVVRTPVTRENLIGAIETALERRDRPPPVWGDGVG